MNEMILQSCGRCRLATGFNVATDADDIDPDCPQHRTFRCIVCGDIADASTIMHGRFDGKEHKPQEEQS